MPSDWEEARRLDESYAGTSPFVRLFTRRGAPPIAQKLANREIVTASTAAGNFRIRSDEAGDVIDILADIGAVTGDSAGSAEVAGSNAAGAALIRAVDTVFDETGITFTELLSTRAKVRCLDVFVRKHYTGLTEEAIADLAGIDADAAHEVRNYFTAVGIVTSPETDGSPTEPRWVIDTDSKAVAALSQLHSQLLYETESIPV